MVPETKRLGEGSAWGRGTDGLGGLKADTENMRRKPDLATAAAIATAAACVLVAKTGGGDKGFDASGKPGV
jgi:hypothetical protein